MWHLFKKLDFNEGSKRKLYYCILIMSTSIIIHCFMLLAFGHWWDDYKWAVIDYASIKENLISAGKLDAYLMIRSINWLPIFFVRFLILSCYSISAVLLFLIFTRVFNDNNFALSISLFYNAIPVNDIRLMKCIYPYTFALLLFWIATFILIKIWDKDNTRKSIFYRVIALILFFISFSTSSLLVFYMIPIGVLFVLIIKKYYKEGRKKTIISILKWPDFYVLPFAFFLIKINFFSPDPSGLYANYNKIEIQNIKKAFSMIVNSTSDLLYQIFLRYHDLMNIKYVKFSLVIIFVLAFLLRKKISKKEQTIKHVYFGLLLGFVIIMIGLFPYLVIRLCNIEIMGLHGRDSILTCLGVAIFLYSLIELLRIPYWMNLGIKVSFLILGFLHFSILYIGYMRDNLNQIALEMCWKNDEIVKNGKTFILNEDRGPIGIGDSFYSLNTMAIETFGDSKRFIACGEKDLYYISDFDKKEIMREDETYGYATYNLDDTSVDGIIYVNCRLGKKDALILLFEKYFMKDKFVSDLLQYIDYRSESVIH